MELFIYQNNSSSSRKSVTSNPSCFIYWMWWTIMRHLIPNLHSLHLWYPLPTLHSFLPLHLLRSSWSIILSRSSIIFIGLGSNLILDLIFLFVLYWYYFASLNHLSIESMFNLVPIFYAYDLVIIFCETFYLRMIGLWDKVCVYNIKNSFKIYHI